MIDLHCHILPGIDDGAPDLATSVEMGRAAVAGGVSEVAATSHVSGGYPNDPLTFAPLRAQVQAALDEASIPLKIHAGAELSLTGLQDMDDAQLAACALGGGRYILLEPPLNGPAPFLDRFVFEVGTRGYRVLLAHPERISWFQSGIDRVEALVNQGAVCSITAASITGRFGGNVKRFTLDLFEHGLVHNIASDAHDPEHRSPALGPELEAAVEALPGLEGWLDWLTLEVPQAIVGGGVVEGAPPHIEGKRGLMGRLRRR